MIEAEPEVEFCNFSQPKQVCLFVGYIFRKFLHPLAYPWAYPILSYGQNTENALHTQQDSNSQPPSYFTCHVCLCLSICLSSFISLATHLACLFVSHVSLCLSFHPASIAQMHCFGWKYGFMPLFVITPMSVCLFSTCLGTKCSTLCTLLANWHTMHALL